MNDETEIVERSISAMKKRTKGNKRWFAAIFMVALALMLVGCGTANTNGNNANENTNGTALANGGTLLLRVNPDIEIDYDGNGLVTAVSGTNDEGRAIVSNYTGYYGRPCGDVVDELVRMIHSAGYFSQEIDGNTRNIVLQLTPGSALPADTFMEDLESGVQRTVSDLGLTSNPVSIDTNDYDTAYDTDTTTSPYITLEKAQEIALAQAGISSANAQFKEKKFDFDDGAAVYELEFYANGMEYDYDIDATTGKVLKAEHSVRNTSGSTGSSAGNSTSGSSTYITRDKAESIAYTHAGISASNVQYKEIEMDMDDGVPVYELEFYADGVEYEYTVHAKTGQVLSFEKETH